MAAFAGIAGLGDPIVDDRMANAKSSEAPNDQVEKSDPLAGEALAIIAEVGGAQEGYACTPPPGGCCAECGGWGGGSCSTDCDATDGFPCCYCSGKNSPHCGCVAAGAQCDANEAATNLVEQVREIVDTL